MILLQILMNPESQHTFIAMADSGDMPATDMRQAQAPQAYRLQHINRVNIDDIFDIFGWFELCVNAC